MQRRTVFGVVVAAGSGSRFGGGPPKQLADLGGQSIVARSVAALSRSGVIDAITVVTRPDLVAVVGELLSKEHPPVTVVAGGASRAASVRAGLATLDGTDRDLVVVHDGARPLVEPRRVAALVATLDGAGAATLAVPVADTVLVVEDGTVTRVPDRSVLYRAQTPQGFRLGLLRKAHRAAAEEPGFVATDDCAVIRRYSPATDIAVIAGSDRNIKITTPADLLIAHHLLADA